MSDNQAEVESGYQEKAYLLRLFLWITEPNANSLALKARPHL